MRAKSDLIPDCDVHGEPMFRQECAAASLGLEGGRDLYVWCCPRPDCERYFRGTVGYANKAQPPRMMERTPQCPEEGAFLVVQQGASEYICPVAGCKQHQPWHASELCFAGREKGRWDR